MVINIFIILNNPATSNFKWCIASIMAVGFLLLKAQNVGLDVSFNLIY